MRVRATAMASAQSNAIGSVELECTPAGLAIGLYGVGAYSEGYAPAAMAHGTRFTVPYSGITKALAAGDRLLLQLDAQGFPHDRLALTRFSAGPGVPATELRKRRLILHFAALSVAVIATVTAALLTPSQPAASIAWGTLAYGMVAALIVLAIGYSLDQRLFSRPPDESVAQESFVADLSRFVPHLVRTDQAPASEVKWRLPPLTGLLPRGVAVAGLVLAATILTALVSGQRMLLREEAKHRAPANSEPVAMRNLGQPSEPLEHATAPTSAPHPAPADQREQTTDSQTADGQPQAPGDEDTAAIERRCLCDRADSPLWRKPIPKLSAVLIEKRVLPRKSFVKTRLELGVVNNSDESIHELTLHVRFFEKKPGSKKLRHTKERPLYFEGPLHPGEAIKWSTEARGTDFEILVPDFGEIGVDGRGAASKDAFAELLTANHRPVRLHAARMLSYLGDPRGRAGALTLKDAMRAAEGPYLRRVLAATADLRVCDIEVTARPGGAAGGTVGACVYNAGDLPAESLGLQISSLAGSLDVSQPLAHPPQLERERKWKVVATLDPQAGRFVRVPMAAEFLPTKGHTVEVHVDRFDLLE